MDAHSGRESPQAVPYPPPEVRDDAFDAARLTLARERTGLTKRDLAARTGVTAAAIAQFERGRSRPTAELLDRVAAELGVPAAYLAAGRPVLPVVEEATHFRSLRATRAYERRQARATMSHLAEAVRVIQRYVRLPDPHLPALGNTPAPGLHQGNAAWGSDGQDAEDTAWDSRAPGAEHEPRRPGVAREPRRPGLGYPAQDPRRPGAGVEGAVRELRSPVLGPERAARELRAVWELPSGPVHHLVRLIESKGAVVSMARFGAGERIDAFSCRPSGLDRPLICLSRDRGNPLRRRFSAAHELGHLMLHENAHPGSRDHEHEADRFAVEFLTPAGEIADLLPSRLDFAHLLEVQRAWGVSVQALLRRCHELGRIDEVLYRRGMATLTRLGWRRDEPMADYPTEWPALLSESVALAAPRGLTEESLAAVLRLPVTEIRELLSHVPDGRPRLRLVTG